MASTFQRQTRQAPGSASTSGYQQVGSFGGQPMGYGNFSNFRPQVAQTQSGTPYMPNPGSFAFGRAQPKTGDTQQGGFATPPASGGSKGFEAYQTGGSYSQPATSRPSSPGGGYATTMAMGEEDGFSTPPSSGRPQSPSRPSSFGPDSPTWNDPRNDKARDRYYQRQQQPPGGAVTTMAMGEEDGFGQTQPSRQPPASPQQPPGGGYATTMAMGEEDGFGGGPFDGTPPTTTQFGGQTYTTGGGYPLPGGQQPGSPRPSGFQQFSGQQFSFTPEPIYEPFQTASFNFDGTASAMPNYNQRDAFISNINNSLGDFWMANRTNAQAPPPQFDFNSLWTEAGRMAQDGWQNPLAGLFM